VTTLVTRRHGSKTSGLLLATAAGLAFGLSDISIKALAERTLGDPAAVISPWLATALIGSVGAFYASARSMRIGEGMAVITVTAVAANVSTIAGGIVVFGEPLGGSVMGPAAHVGAFLLVVAGAALVPGPLRASEAGARVQGERAPRPAARADARAAETV
jgi:hypothetical protein